VAYRGQGTSLGKKPIGQKYGGIKGINLPIEENDGFGSVVSWPKTTLVYT